MKAGRSQAVFSIPVWKKNKIIWKNLKNKFSL